MLFTETKTRARYRVRAARRGEARHLSHLAQIEALRRAARRAFPGAKLAFGPAISVGHESLVEYFDLELGSPKPAAEVLTALSAVLDGGFEALAARRIPAFFPSLESCLNVVRYEILGAFPEDAPERLRAFLDRKEIVIEKIKQGGAVREHVDARPLILRMRLLEDPSRLELLLRFGPKRTVKPEALIREWLGTSEGLLITRADLYSETGSGEFLTP
jgi:radical SAM-linked protein